jgi:hypothetical protein
VLKSGEATERKTKIGRTCVTVSDDRRHLIPRPIASIGGPRKSSLVSINANAKLDEGWKADFVLPFYVGTITAFFMSGYHLFERCSVEGWGKWEEWRVGLTASIASKARDNTRERSSHFYERTESSVPRGKKGKGGKGVGRFGELPGTSIPISRVPFDTLVSTYDESDVRKGRKKRSEGGIIQYKLYQTAEGMTCRPLSSHRQCIWSQRSRPCP